MMPARQRALMVLPVVAAALLFAGVARAPIATVTLLVAALVAAWKAHAFPLNRLTGWFLATGTAALAGIFVPTPWVAAAGPGGLGELSARAAFALLLLASLRPIVTHAEGSAEVGLLLVAAAAVACGRADSGWVYPALLSVVLLSALVSLQQAPAGGPPLRALGPRRLRSLALAVLIASVSATGLIVSLPSLHARVLRQVYRWDRGGSSTGFAGEILLGGAADISESDALVLRIHGPRPDYLRGVVFNRYRNGRWVPGDGDPGTTLPTASDFRDDGATSRLVAVKVGPRYFVPLGASAVGTPSGRAVVDRMGALRALPEMSAATVWFRADGGGELPVLHPGPEDVELPQEIAARLRALAREWTASAAGPREQLGSIEQRLRTTFRYALKHERGTSADPVVDFLWVNRVGHCEYFATAMALLGRSLGIPTRVVSGYRVGEHNPVGDFDVVRERDAHAWVEAWIDGHWATFDPTPPSALSATRSPSTPWLLAVVEWSGDRLQRLNGDDVRTVLFGIAGASGAGAALLLLLRRMRRSRTRLAPREEALVPGMTLVFAALAERGLERGSAETLETYVRRLRGSEGAEAWQSAADLIERYASLLYGGIGARADVQRAAAAWLATRPTPPRIPPFAG